MCGPGEPIPPIPVITVTSSLQPPGVDATILIQPWLIEPWNPYPEVVKEKKKRLIKLICKVKGQTFEEEKEVEDYKITVDDVRMVVKAVTNIDIDVNMGE